MKRLITDVYKFSYKITGAKVFSSVFALICMSFLNFVIIYGLVILLDGYSFTKITVQLFVYPYYFITTFILFLINCVIMLPPEKLAAIKTSKSLKISQTTVYILIAVLLLVYIHYIKKF